MMTSSTTMNESSISDDDVMRRPSGEGRDDLTANDQVRKCGQTHFLVFFKNSALFVHF